MITKAYVVAISEDKSRFKVRIPVLHSIGSDSACTVDSDLPYATLCITCSGNNFISIGDCVFVGFEDNDLGKPIILGKLYGSEGNKISQTVLYSTKNKIIKKLEDSAYHPDINARSIKIDDTAELSKNTSIGDVSSENISHLTGVRANIQRQIDYIIEKLNEILDSTEGG